MVIILMISLKIGTLSLLKMEVFWNKGYDVIISVHDVANNNLSCDSNYIVDVVMWPSLVTPAFQWEKHLTKNITFSEGLSWFKLNNLGLTLGMLLKFYTTVAKGWRVKAKKFLGLIPTFAEVTGENW